MSAAHGGRWPRPALPDNVLGLPLAWLTESALPPLDSHLIAAGTHTPAAAAAVAADVALLARTIDEHGEQDAARAYLDTDDRWLRRRRVAAAVTACVVAGVDIAARDAHPARDRQLRVLLDVERGALRHAVRGWPERTVAVALAEQGAATAQVALVMPDDSVLADEVELRLPATRGHVARTVTIAPWARAATTTAITTAVDQHRPLVLREHGSRQAGQRAVAATLDRAMATVGADATASSLRATAGVQAFTDCGLYAAHRALGTTSMAVARRQLDRIGRPDSTARCGDCTLAVTADGLGHEHITCSPSDSDPTAVVAAAAGRRRPPQHACCAAADR